MIKPKQYFTAREAAKMLRVTYKTVLNKVKDGTLNAERTATGRLRFTEKELKKYGPIDESAKKASCS